MALPRSAASTRERFLVVKGKGGRERLVPLTEVARAAELGAPVRRAPHRNPPTGEGNGPGHREIWVEDPDGYVVVVASPDGEAFEPPAGT